MMNLLAPFGFYGWGNIGDEATLQGFARLVSRSQQRYRVWVGSRNPRHTARVEPSFQYFQAEVSDWRRLWANYRASAVVVPGGTPIMDCLGDWPLCEVVPLVEEANHRGRPIVFVGSGTEQLQREESRRIMADRLVPFVRYWTVRSEPDEARLIEYGVAPERVRVAADMAWLLELVSPDWGREQLRTWGVSTEGCLVGVNLMNEKPVRERHPHLFETVAPFLDYLVENYGASILFLANDVKESLGLDRSATLRTLAVMKHRDRTFLAPNQYWPPQKMMSLIANCYATVSMRYHFCLFSALQGVPFIALQRSDKVTDLCCDLDWSFGSDLNGLSVENLIALFGSLERQRAEAVSQLGVRIPVLREQACRNMIALKTLQDR
jgi:polysaccharide pyruvyl transferase WcaK-like protein